MRSVMRAAAGLVMLVPLVLAGCGDDAAHSRAEAIGDVAIGADRIRQAGCGACHTIPGIDGAEGLVGPPLDHMANRLYLAGLLRNTPANMIHWLREPQAVAPGSVMPDMGLTEQQARDITAYLYTLE